MVGRTEMGCEMGTSFRGGASVAVVVMVGTALLLLYRKAKLATEGKSFFMELLEDN